jgi:DNA processing protein
MEVKQEELLHQLALTRVPNIGYVQAKMLLQHFGSAAAIFKAKRSTLENLDGMGEVRAASIKSFTEMGWAEAELAFVQQYKIELLSQLDERYPKRLLRCYDAPILLYYKGEADLNADKVIAVVGTRNNTDYGKQFLEKFIKELAHEQVLVVSGLAYGIDGIAHKAALHNNLKTVGVLAHGLDKIYPAEHTNMAKEMLKQGGLLTEFPQQTRADRHNFPTRNRVVAGMTDALVVVETATKGGSMITAEIAYNYNKDMFALPGRWSDSKSAGCNQLIKQGKARLLQDAQQLMEVMGWQSKKTAKKKQQRELFIELQGDEQLIYNLLKEKDQMHIDELHVRSGLNSSAMAAAILGLELQGLINSLPGKLYQLVL